MALVYGAHSATLNGCLLIVAPISVRRFPAQSAVAVASGFGPFVPKSKKWFRLMRRVCGELGSFAPALLSLRHGQFTSATLAKLEISRSGKEAFGFYISYLMLCILIGFSLDSIAGILNPDHATEAAFRAGNIGSIIFCCFLAATISFKKTCYLHLK